MGRTSSSINDKIELSVTKGIVLECRSAFVRLKDGFITLGGPGGLFLKTITVPKQDRMRLLEQQLTGRGIDGVYRKPPGEPPPPYVVTETKFRTGGKFDAKDLPTTKGSNGYPRAKQGSSGWVGPRIADAVDRKTALTINKTGYDFWLIVVDESGMVVDITKLDSNANEIGKIAL